MDVQEGSNYLDIDLDSSFYSDRSLNYSDNPCISSDNNSIIENSESISYGSSINEQSIIQQSYDKHSDVDKTCNLNNELEKKNYLINALRD